MDFDNKGTPDFIVINVAEKELRRDVVRGLDGIGTVTSTPLLLAILLKHTIINN